MQSIFFSSIVHFSTFTIFFLYSLHCCCPSRPEVISPSQFHHTCLSSLHLFPVLSRTNHNGRTHSHSYFSDWFSLAGTKPLTTLTSDRKWHPPHFPDFHILSSAKNHLPPNSHRACDGDVENCG